MAISKVRVVVEGAEREIEILPNEVLAMICMLCGIASNHAVAAAMRAAVELQAIHTATGTLPTPEELDRRVALFLASRRGA